MRVVLLFNPHDACEVNALDRMQTELQAVVGEGNVIVEDFQNLRDIYKIRTTPAIVVLRDDLQGENLLEVDEANNKLRAVLECYQVMEQEELFVHNMDGKRVEGATQAEIQKTMGEDAVVMDDMAALLKESGVI